MTDGDTFRFRTLAVVLVAMIVVLLFQAERVDNIGGMEGFDAQDVFRSNLVIIIAP